MSARGTSNSRKLKATLAGRGGNNHFLQMVERTEDAFAVSDDSAVEDVRRILNDVRTQYDHVHQESERKEIELHRLRESIRVADQSHSAKADEHTKDEDLRASLERQQADTDRNIREASTAQKVYAHMLARITREQAILKEKMLTMEGHLGRKSAESNRKALQHERLARAGVQSAMELELLETEVEQERQARDEAHRTMQNALQAKMDARERERRFADWRHEVALDAATEAFNASAGRLRKLYALEKLAGNCLQNITHDQVEKSQATEDGFQKIREVTGLTDVMDIVHKFLNREVEYDQLKSSVKEAEVRLETLKEQYDKFKRDIEGLTFDTDAAGRSRGLYLEVEEHEAALNQGLKEHEQSRDRLQQTTLQIEHMKRWSNRLGRSNVQFEECTVVNKPADLPVFFQQMQKAVDKFIAQIVQQISSGKVQRKNMSQVSSKEYHEASRLLADKDFLKANCRVPASLDAGRPSSRQGQSQGAEEDSNEANQSERDKWKTESKERILDVQRKAEQQKKQQQKGGAK